jgi:tripartite ATP-independent transporter DctM subunit
MITEGYHPQSAQGLVASVGTLAGMIPPSIVLVFYAITAEASVGDLLIAGIVPGLIIGAALVLTMYAGMLRNPSSVPAGRAVPWGHKLAAVVQALPILIVFGSVVGSIFFGIATATEAAAIGCLAALVLVMARKKFNWPAISEALLETVKTSAMIFAIIIGAHIFGHFITETRTTDAVLAWVGSLNTHALVIMGAMTLGYLILGFFMDQVAIIALTVPIALPIVETLGYDPIWFGIFIVLMAEIGLITPPLGLNLFVVARTAGRPVTEVTLGAIPYAAAMLCVAIMFVLWPQIVMWVPSM